MRLSTGKGRETMGKQPSIKRGQPPRGYTSAIRAKVKLGDISDGKLREYVTSGKIKKLVPKGMAQGFYRSSDVNALAREVNDLTDNATFQVVTREDMPELVEFLIEMFGGSNTTEKRLRWMDRNSEIAFILRGTSGIVGCVFVLPTTEAKINEILNDPTPGSTRSFSEDDIQPYIPGMPMHLYIVSMVAKPGRTDAAKRIRGEMLLRGMLRFFVDLGQRGIHIKTLAARTNSVDGIKVLQNAGFTELESNTKSRNFVVDVDVSGLPHIMRYKRAYRESSESK